MTVSTKLIQAAAGAGDEGAWDLSYAYYDDPLTWDISTGKYIATFSVASQEIAPSGLFFKPDGTKMYVVGFAYDAVSEYNLSTAWNISTASYSQNFSVASQETTPYGLFFSPDGTKMYITGSAGQDVNEYNLSTAWDVSSASYSQNFSVSAQETSPMDIHFKSDGTKMYIVGTAGDDVNEYDLSTAWDISTASYLQNFSVASQGNAPTGLFFKDDGTRMYVTQNAGDKIDQYNLSTAWDVSTASYNQSLTVSSQDTEPEAVFIRPDGSAVYIAGNRYDSVYQYTLGGFSVDAQDAASQDVFFKPEGDKMYVVGSSNDSVYEYNLTTEWNLSTASYNQSFSISAQELTPTGLSFKDDGTKMYIVGATGDDVNEYNLSTAWDISTATYSQNFSVSAQETSPRALYFKPDGTEMYIVGPTFDTVYKYNLSTAWDISTASYASNSFSVAAQELVPQGLFFKGDGTKMYVSGNANNSIFEYDLSTAWDVSTASYTSNNFLVSNNPSSVATGFYFKSDGTKVFVSDIISRVYTYTLGVQE